MTLKYQLFILIHFSQKQAYEYRAYGRQKSYELRPPPTCISPEVSIIHEEEEPSNVSSRSSLNVCEL